MSEHTCEFGDGPCPACDPPFASPLTTGFDYRPMRSSSEAIAEKERSRLRDELDAVTIKLDAANRRIQWLEGALRPFSSTVCSMRWLWRDQGITEGESEAEEDGLTCSWSELLDAHEALNPEGCNADDCVKKTPTQAGGQGDG